MGIEGIDGLKEGADEVTPEEAPTQHEVGPTSGEPVETVADAEAREQEARQIEETDNSARPEDGPQPAQDETPDLEPEEEA